MSNSQANSLPDIVKTVVMKAPITKVWNAVATSEGLAAWYMPNDFEPVEGRPFTLHGPYGPSPCKVTKVEAPHLLTFTWDEDWVITFRLQEQEGKTVFTLIHSGWVAGKVFPTGMSHNEVHDRMNNGWESQVLPRLVEYVEA